MEETKKRYFEELLVKLNKVPDDKIDVVVASINGLIVGASI